MDKITNENLEYGSETMPAKEITRRVKNKTAYEVTKSFFGKYEVINGQISPRQ